MPPLGLICVGCGRELSIDDAYVCCDPHDGESLAVGPLCKSCVDAHVAVTHKPVAQE